MLYVPSKKTALLNLLIVYFYGNSIERVMLLPLQRLFLKLNSELIDLGLQSAGGRGIDRERRSIFTVIVAAGPGVSKRQASDSAITYTSVSATTCTYSLLSQSLTPNEGADPFTAEESKVVSRTGKINTFHL